LKNTSKLYSTWGKLGNAVSISISGSCWTLTIKVVLLDEADVFLEQRRLRDLQRNAFVSGKHPRSQNPYVKLI
jgi:hypothetical protein